ncbi:ecdysone 20-monooxygenase isoform X1 [Periplaneta americana]|uniref:ecdysone 20-monooxygenase isoform X1 n=2 Tax=Periplaneta americana TaxID=6978 RepID=UPI0037E964E5
METGRQGHLIHPPTSQALQSWMLRLLKLSLEALDVAAVIVLALVMFLTECRPMWKNKASPPPQLQHRRRSVRDIPGPRPALPVLGTRWIYSVFGRYKMNQIHEAYRDMFQRYGRIIREEAFWNFPVVSLLERRDIEAVLKQPSKYPLRPPTEVIAYYRQSRPDRYTTLGIVNEQGEKWHMLRNILTPELTSAKTIQRFLPELNLVAEDFISLLRTTRDKQNMVAGFEEMANRMGLESTCTLILGRRMGFLDSEVDPLAARLASAVKNHFCASRDTFYGLPFWKVFPTRAYKMLVNSEDQIYDIVSELVESALKEERDTCALDAVSSVFMSVLNAPGLDVREKKSAIIDFIAAGIQTLGNTVVFVLYLIAKHPRVQERLYEEMHQLAPGRCPLRAETLRSATYLQACIMEAFRVLPTATCVARILETEMELSGYQLSPGTVVLCHTWLACQEEANFTSASEFLPERWLHDGELMRTSPFLVVPFGCGRRICPGKRFVEQELHLVLAKIVREFHVDFEGELDLQFEFLLAPQAPTNFIFRDRNE